MSILNDLVRRALAGDKEAENDIFRFLSVRFRLFVRQKVGDVEVADDIAQKACITILEKYKTEKFSVGFEAWAYGVLKMGVKNYFHGMTADRKKINAILPDMDDAPQTGEIEPATEMALHKCLEKVIAINRRYARVLNLAYQGFKADEICLKLGVTRNNYYVILNRARSLLWECLKGRTE
ncbi:MAG: hypothetical protein CVT49_09705 [candidate division Zixibacteria bacterium HGW-Zixibacteria-1]|nr:MAG: hypothetical protein CVT49_09705 [candidate division Zixibacteria bacterium HGW-Zixibacteria-1]